MDGMIALEDKYSPGLYIKQPLAFERGSGAVLYTKNGEAYLDCSAGHGVANLGHAHPAVANAIAQQAQRLITLPESFHNSQRALLFEKLIQLIPGMQSIFLCNSGTEAVEAALKFARVSSGRTQVIAALRGFHGRTFGALSATANKNYRQPFEPLVPGFQHVPYNNFAALEQAVNFETAAVILEIVQGEGGVYLADPDYLLKAQELCHDRGALLIIDEVQTGFGRTGKLFAIEHSGLKPDLLCAAKSIAGGLPMGAVLIGERVQNLKPGLHASTFGGNPLACAAALAVLKVMEEDEIPRQAAEKGGYFLEKLRTSEFRQVREVRGLGLMIGIEIKHKVAPYLRALQERRVLALSAGLTTIRLLPPLVITYDQLDQVYQELGVVLAAELKEIEE